MNAENVVSRSDWLKARMALLEKEKNFMRQRDALSAERRRLPWVLVDKDYVFHSAQGNCSLAALFGNKSQLIVQHFMFGEDWNEGCPSCSFWADGFNGTSVHFAHRDATFIAVSNAPYAQIDSYKKRMGWQFDWVSCHGSGFNHDYRVSFEKSDIESGSIDYNYRQAPISMNELPGISIFIKDATGQIFHTYSCYSRGLDNMNVVYQYLDLLPKGRDEDSLDFTMAWVRRHDQYGD